jgi:predicted pyridoxine 5'-phosphate oxidase superfamily flavin-nucleotide-binding protein
MITVEMKSIIENNAGALATIDDEGCPHLIAVAHVKVVSPTQVLITDNYMNETVRNILRNRNISLIVWNKEWEEECVGCELRGTGEYSTIGKWFDMVRQMPENTGLPKKGALLINVKKVKRLV